MTPRQFIKVGTADILSSCLSGTAVDTSRFEAEFAEYIGVQYAKAVYTGRTALRVILDSLDIGVGDEVIIPALCCPVVGKTVAASGAVPILVDVDSRTFTLDPESVSARIGERTKAVIAVHIFGMPCDMVRLEPICRDHGIPIIEDCAEALGATVNGHKVGSFGTVSLFSLGKGKNITCGEGGVICSNDPKTAEIINRSVDRLAPPPAWRVARDLVVLLAYQLLPYAPKMFYSLLDRYFRARDERAVDIPMYNFPHAKAGIARKQLACVDAKNHCRKTNSGIINRLLIFPRQEAYPDTDGTYLYHAVISESKDAHKEQLLKLGIDATDYMHTAPYLRATRSDDHPLRVTERLLESLLFIPNHEQVTQKALDRLSDLQPGGQLESSQLGQTNRLRSRRNQEQVDR